MFSDLIVLYLFLGGVGAGTLVVLSAVEAAKTAFWLANRREASFWLAEVVCLPEQFLGYAWPVCWVCVSLGILCLALDIGHPDRILGFVTSPRLSAMTVGAYSLVAAFVCSGGFALRTMLDGMPSCLKARLAFSIAGIVSGFAMALYTGVLLQGSAAILLWQSPFLPALFLLSSLSCGMAVALAALAFTRSRRPVEEQARLMANADTVLVVAEVIVLAGFLAHAAIFGGTQRSVWALLFGDLGGAFWTGLVIIGLAMPLAVERFVPVRNFRPQLLWTAACLLLGAVTLRWLVVMAATYDVTQSAELLYGFAASLL